MDNYNNNSNDNHFIITHPASWVVEPAGTPLPRAINSKLANDWVAEAALRPNPRPLWKELWYEGELTCLFADTNVGKSIYAIQIANHIGRSEKVMYFDFEMSDKQFQLRYTDPSDNSLHRFSDGFLRAEMSQDAPVIDDISLMIDVMVQHCIQQDIKIIIIDNISWICNRSESGDAAGELMQKLVEVKRRYGMSILVLAHTPKRNMSAPLNQNSLAGSKKLANFFDAIFAIGLDKNNRPAGRYIKQIKVRTGELIYGETNVIVCRLEKEGSDLRFTETGRDWERTMLEEPDAADIERDQARTEVLRRLGDGQSIRSIGRELGMSKSAVMRLKQSKA